jgi:Gpi18-like mannosyltransferase
MTPAGLSLFVWGFARVFLSVMAALFSSIRPPSAIEKQIAIWPPATEIGSWLYRVWLAPWVRWDVVWYVTILTSGYKANDGSTSFHPLYTLLSAPLYLLGFDPLLSLMLTGSIASLGLFWVFYKLASIDLSPERSRLALLLLATFPISFILFTPYTESTFLFFTVLALYQLRKRRWLLAALATMLASLARQQGIFLILPMLWYIWEDYRTSPVGLLKAWRVWLALISAPFGLVVWAIYRLGYLHEGTLDLNNLQGFIYSALLSPSSKEVIPDQAMIWPWQALTNAIVKISNTLQVQGIFNLTIGMGFVLLFALAWKYMTTADRLYSLGVTLVSFSLSVGSTSTYVYMSLPRHLLPAVPVFIGLASALKKPWQQWAVISVQFSVEIFALMIFVFHTWIP